MKLPVLLGAILTVLLFTALPQTDNAKTLATRTVSFDQCKVTDPTGTPLNVRDSPNGRILRRVRNRTVVYIEQTTYDSKNRPWVRISQPTGKGRIILGWVYREFISCY